MSVMSIGFPNTIKSMPMTRQDGGGMPLCPRCAGSRVSRVGEDQEWGWELFCEKCKFKCYTKGW